MAAEEPAPLPAQIVLVLFFLVSGIWTIYSLRRSQRGRYGSKWERRLRLGFGYLEVLAAIYLTVILLLWW
ncbi:MAG: hypothetical protein QOI95_3077 [Acidimicrobiaceae bacterium]